MTEQSTSAVMIKLRTLKMKLNEHNKNIKETWCFWDIPSLNLKKRFPKASYEAKIVGERDFTIILAFIWNGALVSLPPHSWYEEWTVKLHHSLTH